MIKNILTLFLTSVGDIGQEIYLEKYFFIYWRNKTAFNRVKLNIYNIPMKYEKSLENYFQLNYYIINFDVNLTYSFYFV